MVRKHGFALDNEELEEGLRCVAAPVLNHENKIVAGVAIAGSSAHVRTSLVDSYAEKVKKVATLISMGLGFQGVIRRFVIIRRVLMSKRYQT